MSEPVESTVAPAAETTPAPVSTEVPATETTTATTTAPVTEPEVSGESKAVEETPAVAAEEEAKEEVAPAKPAEKAVEPITEGQLAVKGPGLIKSIVPSKKEFWLSDSAVTPQNMDMYLRGEKPEVAHPVVAWASQTGKGLLFFNKKGETNRARPQSVLPLYDATDLKKAHPHEITFKLHGHEHVLKASNDAEQEGWFISLQRAIEVGKAEKETVRASEGYKAEIEKLGKPNTISHSVAAIGAAARSKSQAKSTDEARRTGSDAEETDKQKSRSTSRGMLDRLKAKKNEEQVKREEKKEEKEEAKAEKEAKKSGDATPVGAGAAPLDAPAVAERAVGAPVETNETPAVDSAAAPTQPESGITKAEEKPSKRGSIFGRMHSGFSSLRSPSKEKSEKEAELKPAVPPKDATVSDTAPQIPAAEPAAPIETADKPVEPVEASKPTEATKEAETSPATHKKSGLLSGLPFIHKRDRSASPSAAMKETSKKEETAAAAPVDEPATETPAATEAPATTTETPAATEPVAEEPTKPTETASPSTDKRQSVFGNLGRRASKAFKGLQTPKRETAAPAAATATTPAKTEETAPVVDGKSQPIEPATVETNKDTIGQAQTTPTVTASA